MNMTLRDMREEIEDAPGSLFDDICLLQAMILYMGEDAGAGGSLAQEILNQLDEAGLWFEEMIEMSSGAIWAGEMNEWVAVSSILFYVCLSGLLLSATAIVLLDLAIKYTYLNLQENSSFRFGDLFSTSWLCADSAFRRLPWKQFRYSERRPIPEIT
jgi:hypothetical protein